MKELAPEEEEILAYVRSHPNVMTPDLVFGMQMAPVDVAHGCAALVARGRLIPDKPTRPFWNRRWTVREEP